MTTGRKRGAVLLAANRAQRNRLKHVAAVFQRLPGDNRPRSDAAKRKMLRTLHLDGSPLVEWRCEALYISDAPGHGVDRNRHPLAAAWLDLVLLDGLPATTAAKIAAHRGGKTYTLAGARLAVRRDLQAAGLLPLWESHKNRSGRPGV